ncbi:hypothetical protein BDV19DRAFT_387302 [Aspergillus venezuelensis]
MHNQFASHCVGYFEIEKLLLEMKGQMVQQSEALEALHKSYQLQRRDDGPQSSQVQASTETEDNEASPRGSITQNSLAQDSLFGDGLSLSNPAGSLGSMIDPVGKIDTVPEGAEDGNSSQVFGLDNLETCTDDVCNREEASTKPKNLEGRQNDDTADESTGKLELEAEAVNPEIRCQLSDVSDEEWEEFAQHAESLSDFLSTAPDRIAEKRLSVLSRIKDLVDAQLGTYKTVYEQSFTQDGTPIPARLSYVTGHHIFSESLVSGYLSIEKMRWLSPSSGASSANEFAGVSFSSVCNCIRTMTDIQGWTMRVEPPSSLMA